MHGFVASNPRGKSFNFASTRGMIFGAIGHLEAIPPLKECNRNSIAMQSWCDRGSIAPRSRRSSRSILRRQIRICRSGYLPKRGENPTSRGRWIAIAQSEC